MYPLNRQVSFYPINNLTTSYLTLGNIMANKCNQYITNDQLGTSVTKKKLQNIDLTFMNKYNN